MSIWCCYICFTGLQLAIEKAKMYAKSEIADIVAGEMNKQSKQFITELGKTHTKQP